MKNKRIEKELFYELDDYTDGEEDAPKWNVICKTVVSKSHAAGDFVITKKMLLEAADNFHNRSTKRVPMYFEHYGSLPTEKIDPEKGAPAQGYVIDMQVRSDGNLWGLCEFLEPAKTYVKQKKYRFFSPGLFTNSLDRGSGKSVGMRITEVSLVGNPHLYDMPEIQATDNENGATGQNGSTFLENGTTSATNVLTTRTSVDRNIGKDKMNLEEALAKITELELGLRTKDLELRAKEAEKAELKLTHTTTLNGVELQLSNTKAELDKLVKEVVDVDVTRAFETYKKAHEFTEEHKADLKALRLSNPQSFARLYPVKTAAVPGTVQARDAGNRAAQDNRPAWLGATLSAVPRQQGEEQPLSFSELKAKLLKEDPKLSNEDAVLLAYNQLSKGTK